jgi:hypothetical protein
MEMNVQKGRASSGIAFALLAFAAVSFFSAPAFADDGTSANLPVTRVSLFSSGVGYFEHNGSVSGNASVPLVFSVDVVNDVLKSLVIHDPGSSAPSVRYDASDTLERTLRSLKIDLSENPGVAEILGNLRGAELTVRAPEAVTGRILGVETRVLRNADDARAGSATESYLSLVTASGIRVIGLGEIASFSFSDPAIASDLSRALDLILSSKDSLTRSLSVNLPGKGERKVSLGYVVPAPVWKASYRLDLGGAKPFFQGWAIVDNAGDSDWNGVELSLVNGKPVSFIQQLYPPLWFSRAVVPLSIAGSADAVVYDSGYGADMMEKEALAYEEYDEAAPAPVMKSLSSPASPSNSSAGSAFARGGMKTETATARNAGDLFVFTAPKPVTIARHSSAMIPLVETALQAEKVSVLSGASALAGETVHPMLCASLVNTSGMKLPAGPITVFDSGSYAGDALIEFFPEGDKRIIAFGEDLAVNVGVSSSDANAIDSVSVANGVMTLSRKRVYSKTYSIRNLASEAKKIIVEHSFVPGATLVAPAKYDEKTDSVYRLGIALAAKADATLEVKESVPVRETVALTRLTPDSLAYYSASGEIPGKVKTALAKAADFLRAESAAKTKLAAVEGRKDSAVENQDRIRQNLEAAGSDSAQGKEYLHKLAEADTVIEKLDVDIEAAQKAVSDARAQYEAYIAGLSL